MPGSGRQDGLRACKKLRSKWFPRCCLKVTENNTFSKKVLKNKALDSFCYFSSHEKQFENRVLQKFLESRKQPRGRNFWIISWGRRRRRPASKTLSASNARNLAPSHSHSVFKFQTFVHLCICLSSLTLFEPLKLFFHCLISLSISLDLTYIVDYYLGRLFAQQSFTHFSLTPSYNLFASLSIILT